MTVARWRDRKVFGWTTYLSEPDPEEAGLIRQAVLDVIGGASPFDVARGWNALGLVTTSGSHWYGQTVEATLRRATNVSGPAPILTHEVFDALLARLNGPGRTSTSRSRTAYEKVGFGKYVSSNVVTCGICGSPVQRVGAGSNKRPLFGCRRRAVNGITDRERHPTVDLVETEERVIDATVEEMVKHLGISHEEATMRFEEMSLLDKRVTASTYFSVTVEPLIPAGGVVKIERRA